ncbi:MAG: polyphosphate polymerase domain-containing protein [Oscillospiraceae bacterium]|nr:polyphosphate polymerase domain-containing protein [Oscillospiraceae bacterium]
MQGLEPKSAYGGRQQTVFRRYELKYLLSERQKQKILFAMEAFMQPDRYGQTTVRNLYYDTDNYLLIRRSVEKPAYKEKLRIRSYSQATADDTVFVELKKKYENVVYKRRIPMQNKEVMKWLAGEQHSDNPTQIAEEIDYFLSFYGALAPKVFLSYRRQAYYAKDGSDFRITFDDQILCRQTDLSLQSDVYGTEILPAGQVLMEIKCSGGIPLWLTKVLSEEKIYKTSFSKYGTAYKTLIFPQNHKMNAYQMAEVNVNV